MMLEQGPASLSVWLLESKLWRNDNYRTGKDLGMGSGGIDVEDLANARRLHLHSQILHNIGYLILSLKSMYKA